MINMANNIGQQNQQQQQVQLGNTMSRSNANPDMTQNQSANMPFGQGAGIMDSQQIPNVTRKVQYTAEGNDPFSQLISAGDMMIHNAGQDFGSGTVSPNHYDVINGLYDMGTGMKNFAQSAYHERMNVRPNTTNERLNERFTNNIEDILGRREPVDYSLASLNHPTKLDTPYGRDAAEIISKKSTKDLMEDYYDALTDWRNPAFSEDKRPDLFLLRQHHNELARRGIDTSIFNHGKTDDEVKAAMANELRDHNNRYGIFRENPEDFYNRSHRFSLPQGHPLAAPPPPLAEGELPENLPFPTTISPEATRLGQLFENPDELIARAGEDVTNMPSDQVAGLAHSHYALTTRGGAEISQEQAGRHRHEYMRLMHELRLRGQERLFPDMIFEASRERQENARRAAGLTDPEIQAELNNQYRALREEQLAQAREERRLAQERDARNQRRLQDTRDRLAQQNRNRLLNRIRPAGVPAAARHADVYLGGGWGAAAPAPRPLAAPPPPLAEADAPLPAGTILNEGNHDILRRFQHQHQHSRLNYRDLAELHARAAELMTDPHTGEIDRDYIRSQMPAFEHFLNRRLLEAGNQYEAQRRINRAHASRVAQEERETTRERSNTPKKITR
jgi:hypothetical protein